MLSEVTERAFIVNSLLFRAIIRLGRHQRCNRSQDINVSINQCRVAPFLQLSVVYDPFLVSDFYVVWLSACSR